MSDKAVLFLETEELITLGVLAIEGFKKMISEHVMADRHDIGRLVKCGALVNKLCKESEEHAAKQQPVPIAAAAELVGGESDPL